MKTIRLSRKNYVTPTIHVCTLPGYSILAGSGDKELPFDPGDGTEEALSPSSHGLWDDEDDNKNQCE